MKPGSMAAKNAWLLMLGASVLAGALAVFANGWLGVGLIAVGGFLSTFLTKASKGLGIGAAFVGSTLYAIVFAVGGILMLDSMMADANAELATQLQGQGAAAAQAGTAMMGALGTGAIIFGAVVSGIVAFVVGLIAAIVGASARPKADAQPAGFAAA
ncbi:MAG: hypothetical protein H6722_15000 [Sandaracinus sp.]|nr:hypothetical protein [Sandaracinus sp.]MCB9613749.1 hypothetical protein [Sandaracinus sp.]